MIDGKEHSHKTNRIVVRALRVITKDTCSSYDKTKTALRTGDEKITFQFWLYMQAKYPRTYNELYYCQSCQKFGLDFDPTVGFEHHENMFSNTDIKEVLEVIEEYEKS